MDFQRDVTLSILEEVRTIGATPEPGNPAILDAMAMSGARTRDWFIEMRKMGADGRLGPARARASGANGEFALEPILVEVRDPLLRGPWLERLLRAYRERGWPCEVKQPRD